MIRYLRLSLRLLAFALWTLALVPLQLLVLIVTRNAVSYIIPRLWHKGVLHIANTRVIVTGTPTHDHCFFVGNHISSMDIPILGSVLKASFVAKADVESYPIFGFLAGVQQTVFISRNQAHAKLATAKMRAMLKAEKNLIIFPEGTSTDASHIMPFKSSLFSVPIDFANDGVVIQPFTLALLSVEGKTDLDRQTRNQFTLSPDVEFWQNFFSIMGLSEAVVRLHFHAPIMVAADMDRKSLAQTAYDIVASPLE